MAASEPPYFRKPHHNASERWSAGVPDLDGCGLRETLRREVQRTGAPLQVAVEAYGPEAQLALVARGLGLVPARALARSPERSRLQTFRVKGHDLRLTVWSVRARPREGLQPVLDALDVQLSKALPAPRRR